jgi:hypothetical protein
MEPVLFLNPTSLKPAGNPSRDGSAADPDRALIASVLAAGLMLDGRTFHPIAQDRPGADWRTLRQQQGPDAIAALVVAPDVVVGLRHREKCRLVALDIDTGSAWWSPAGPATSPQALAFTGQAEASGCSVSWHRTPSGGWHCWAALPAPVQQSLAHQLVAGWAEAAGMTLAAGKAEAFPSFTPYSPIGRAWQWAQCHGIRLPGQARSALWTGTGWALEPSLQWQELAAGLELAAAAAADPAWLVALEDAHRRRRIANPRHRSAAPQRRGPRKPVAVAWTGPDQSNYNLGRLATALWAPGIAADTLAGAIEAAAIAAPGFHQWASGDTRRRLSTWCLDWARCCIRRPPGRGSARPAPSHNAGRNAVEHRRAVVAVIDGAVRLVAEHGTAAFELSERVVSEALKISRSTFRRLKSLFLSRVTAALFPVRSTGSHPLPKGYAPQGAATAASCPAVPVLENQSFPSVSTGPPAPDRPPPPPPPAVPTSPARVTTARRDRERDEIARWLGQAAASCGTLP